MNERIKELLKKAQKITAENYAPGGRDYEREIYSKFAELIVKECARISVEADDTMTNQGEASAQAFMEHFGVKE